MQCLKFEFFLRTVRRSVAFAVLLIWAAVSAIAQAPDQQGFEIMKNLDIFSNTIKELDLDYVDKINPGELTQTGIEAMLESLDPYTNFIPESQVEDYKFITTGQYGGIGALIHQQGNAVVISEPYEGSPAHKAGLKAGDRIIELNGKPTAGKSYEDVSSILKGQSGSMVHLRIQREGEPGIIEKNITREIIKIDNIPFSGMVSEGIGYIKLTGFTQNAGKEVKQAFMKLREGNKLQDIIIDLRGNGGGLLNEAVDIANLFVERGQEIVSTKGKMADKNRTHFTMNPPVDLNIPVVVLVDRQSASASEILAGSLQDLDRGVIVGQRTFGKGLVQNVVPLSYNAQIKITVAKYYIPSGRCIQAIDYEHKKKDGSFGKIPDSLIRAFKTRNGRTVYDGGGIQPDLLTEPRKFSNVALSLYSKYLIFDFATRFEREHPAIPPAGEFEISDTVYNQFLDYIKDKDYSYTTRSERALEQLKSEAVRDHCFDSITGEYNHLKERMAENKKEDLKRYRDQIKELLKMEIVTRYYFQKGKIEASLKQDKELSEAIGLLKEKEKYTAILAGKYHNPKPEIPIRNDEEDDNPLE
ncbi:MAG: PDZ domain-containing protein [Alphaproteobacteria bacterium]|nr:PDZ domain-containing protein [Alphaproteobacteria bacterium]